MPDLELSAALSCNDLIGPVRYRKIVSSYPDLNGFFQLSAASQMEFLGIRDQASARFFETMIGEGEKAVRVCREENIRIVRMEDGDYPRRLKEIPGPPFLFYLRGELNHSLPAAGVVGTRDPSPDSVAINEYFVRELVNCGIGIVSGMAMGHDGIAQKTALDNGGYTAAVLGCGIDIAYPAAYRNLYERIRNHGAVISEYPPGRRAMSHYFPLRNRIISGLSDVVLLMQAPEKSGALITAKYAEAQGRDVYVVPGNPTDPRYAGSNRLIRSGCKLALSPEDIILDLGGGTGREPVRKLRRPEFGKTPDDLGPVEMKLLELLERETVFDELVERSGLGFGELNLTLTKMEIRGLVSQYPGRIYMRNVAV